MTYSKEYIDRAEEVILHTYNRFQIVLDKGNGVHLYDVDGKEYLDFAAGIAVFALGYNNQAYNQALKDQIDKVIHTSNLYYNVPMMEAAEKLVTQQYQNHKNSCCRIQFFHVLSPSFFLLCIISLLILSYSSTEPSSLPDFVAKIISTAACTASLCELLPSPMQVERVSIF